ncbi:MAG TPA: hypothetical protein VGC14_05390 [Rhizobium sp.]
MMIPTVTHLHLLQHTPFFTDLNRPQLQWVIDHSYEWQAAAGVIVAVHTEGEPVDDAVWVLLDGGWNVEIGERHFPSGHADPGKWFSAADVSFDCRLVVTETSYVMKIERKEMQVMINRGFAFDRHLDSGRCYYRDIA